MIDYIALSIGHGLMAIVLLRLFMNRDVDFDPLIEGVRDKMRENRMEASSAGRSAKRRADAQARAEMLDDQPPERSPRGKQRR